MLISFNEKEQLSSGYGKVKYGKDKDEDVEYNVFIETIPQAIKYLVELYGPNYELPHTVSELERRLLERGLSPMKKDLFVQLTDVKVRRVPVVFYRAVLFDYKTGEFAKDKDGQLVTSDNPTALKRWLKDNLELHRLGILNNDLNRRGLPKSKLGVKVQHKEVDEGKHTEYLTVYENAFGEQYR